MADEASINSGLTVRVGALVYQSQPPNFRANVSLAVGPTPGAIRVPVAGVNVSFSQLIQPGLCRIMNLDTINFITVGIYDPDTARFFPLMDVLPRESYVIRLSQFFQSDVGTGTGTDTSFGSRLHIRADTAQCVALVEAFET